METEEKETPVAYRSVSQIKQYGECPYQYYLQRRKRAWQKPAAWTAQGVAGHAVLEWDMTTDGTLDLEAAKRLFSEYYADEIEKLTAETPNLDFWYWSGPYNPWTDVKRRHDIGHAQIERWFEFCDMNPGHEADRDPDGNLMVEYPFDVRIGDVEVRGIIDQVVNWEPIDAKFGNRNGDVIQLVTYGEVLHLLFDVRPKTGAFWYGKNGKLVKHDLTDWSSERLVDAYGTADEGITEERFDPKPEKSRCRFCPVNRACEYSAA